MRLSNSDRVKKHRAHLREKGPRPIQIWVPDTHKAGFAAECKRQSLVAKNAEDERETMELIRKLSGS